MLRKGNFLRNLILFGVFFYIIISCKVGLGESVDTKAPDVSISYPPANSYVKGTVVFSGNASDDEYLSSVSVSFKRTDVQENSSHKYNAVLQRSDKTWTCAVETGDGLTQSGGQKICDGIYEVTVTAMDAAGRKTEMRRTITVDNKPPTVLVKSPSMQ